MEILNIRDLKPGLKNLNLLFVVLEVGRPNSTKDGHEVRTCKIADKTGSVNISIWDEPGIYIQSGDICKLTKGYSSMWKGMLTVYTGKVGEITKIGEFTMQFSEQPNMSEISSEMTNYQQNKMQINNEQRTNQAIISPNFQAMNQNFSPNYSPTNVNGASPHIVNNRIHSQSTAPLRNNTNQKVNFSSINSQIRNSGNVVLANTFNSSNDNVYGNNKKQINTKEIRR